MNAVPVADRSGVGLPWLVRLRWGVVAGELLTGVLARSAIGPGAPVMRLAACLGVTVLTNVLLMRQLRAGRPASAGLLGAVLSLDVLLFTFILHATGGPSNPFSILYLVYITLAAVVLGAAWTWGLASLAVVCYGALFLVPSAVGPHEHHMMAGAAFSSHLREMWLAFAVAAGLTAYFVVRLSAALEQRDAEIAAVRAQVERSERLASLTTLAAGAAHELGTPLATIAVAARELEHAVAQVPDPHGRVLVEDTRLIRAELARCRRILDQMASDAGEPAGEAPTMVTLDAIVDDVLRGLGATAAARIRRATMPVAAVTAPRRVLGQVVTSLVRNALDATEQGGGVELAAVAEANVVRIEVRDEGAGMTDDVLAHAVEPFFSTKPPGHGLGLGLFLAKSLAERMGGRLLLHSVPGRGTTAALELPVTPALRGAA